METAESLKVSLLEVNLFVPDRLVLPGWLAELIGRDDLMQARLCSSRPEQHTKYIDQWHCVCIIWTFRAHRNVV